jgi:hypothetical protein
MGRNISFQINEKLDLLILTAGDHIYLLRLSSGELIETKDLTDFASFKEVRAITMANPDSLFIYSYYSRGAKGDSLCSGVAVQDWNNKILWQKKFNYLSWTVLPEPINYQLLHGSNISVLDTDNPREFIFQVDNHDTCYVFNLNDFSLQPYLLRRTMGALKDKYPIDRVSQGCYTIGQESNRTNGIHIMRMQLITKLVDINNIDDYVYNIFYDDNNKTAFNISSFENDYLGFIHQYNGLNKERSNYPELVPPYGKFLMIYEANEFLKLANQTLKKPDLSKEIRDRINSLTVNLTETSNPVLLIGDLKKNIKLR